MELETSILLHNPELDWTPLEHITNPNEERNFRSTRRWWCSFASPRYAGGDIVRSFWAGADLHRTRARERVTAPGVEGGDN